jgi:hypothetical protein
MAVHHGDATVSIRLWIDDLRKPPSDEWTWAKTLEEAMDHIRSPVGVSEISFDHDLGVKDLTMENEWINSQPVARYLEDQAQSGELIVMPVWWIHSMNPRGRKELLAILQRAERFIDERRCPYAIHDGRVIVGTK